MRGASPTATTAIKISITRSKEAESCVVAVVAVVAAAIAAVTAAVVTAAVTAAVATAADAGGSADPLGAMPLPKKAT